MFADDQAPLPRSPNSRPQSPSSSELSSPPSESSLQDFVPTPLPPSRNTGTEEVAEPENSTSLPTDPASGREILPPTHPVESERSVDKPAETGSTEDKRSADEPAETDGVLPRSKRARVDANLSRIKQRSSAKKLTQQTKETQSSVPIKEEPKANVKKINLYHLGPCTTTYKVFAQLVNFAMDVPANAPLMLNVATLPKAQAMTQVIGDTVRNYARSRTSSFSPNITLTMSDDAVEVVDLNANMLQEPTEIIRARNLQDSLARLSAMWKQSTSMTIRKRLMESWAMDILYNVAGLNLGDLVDRKSQSIMKKAAMELIPVLRPSQLQGDSSQNILRVRYYWGLLTLFRARNAAFIVAYRPKFVDAILLSDRAGRLNTDDVNAWIPIIQLVERHVTTWFDALENATGRPEVMTVQQSLYAPSTWASPEDQVDWNFYCAPATPHADLLPPETPLNIATYGHDGYLTRRKIWSVMETPSRESISICDIPEASFLGIVPGRLRCGFAVPRYGIPGPDGIWLDTREATGPLSNIALGPPGEVNTVLAWHIAGDFRSPLWKTAFLMAFSSRPIKAFHQLVRWDRKVARGE